MAPKYTILKVLTQTFSKTHKTNRGFTLIELIVGLCIMLIVGGLAMNAFLQASTTFNKDKKNIDSTQNLSAILELIGTDIKQSGEQINDAKFPVIKIENNTDSLNMPGSSKITIRRGLTTPLTLCEPITSTSTNTTLRVADDSVTNTNCNVGTLTINTSPTTISRPKLLMDARNIRCKLDDINGNYTVANTDFCLSTKATPDLEQVPAAMSDGKGHVRTFQYVDDGLVPSSTNKYQINITGLSAGADPYDIASPIYLMEERIYKLNSDGSLVFNRDGGNFETLIKGIKNFKVSARVYGNKATKEPDLISPASTPVAPNLLPLSRRCDPAIPYYICTFNTTDIDDWKTLQGVKIDLEAKYDSTGRASESSTNPGDMEQVAREKDKLKVTAEFFPRNVLSR